MRNIAESPILPGQTLGVLGSGQLGRMFAMAAKTMGYRVVTYSPEKNTPAGQICDVEICASYEDHEALESFARQVDGVTLEFENIPVVALETLEALVPIYPQSHVLYIAQHRGREKAYLQAHGFPVAPFCMVSSQADLMAAVEFIGTPAILKTAGFGYDGKGQVAVNQASEIQEAWAQIGDQPAILEQRIDFEKELSVIGVRSIHGEFVHYAVAENQHHRHILDVSMIPAGIEPDIQQEAIAITRDLMAQLNMVGVLCVEFFLTRSGQLLINEIAPRPHNSGHWTLDAAITSQFEQQVRALCGLPLGATTQTYPAAMANLLGDLWENGEPDWVQLLDYPTVKLHLYGKTEARLGRKMGHLSALGVDGQSPKALVKKARSSLMQPLKESLCNR